MDKETKAQIIKDYAVKEGDVGSSEVQVAILSHRIAELTAHMKAHPNDKHSERGLVLMVNKRRKLLKYLNRKHHKRYLDLIKRLGLRRQF